MFRLLNRRGRLVEPPPLGETDAHCHILPGIDDGPEDDLGALAMGRLLYEMGVRKVVATPHVISDVYPNTTARIVAAVKNLQRLFSASGLAIELEAGAEYYAEGELLDRIERRDLLAFGKERYVLFESPLERRPMIFDEIAFSIAAAGYTPLLAHVERYRFLRRDRNAIERLRKLGVRFQVNYSSFFLPKTNRCGEMARSLYLKGLVDVLGTDMHSASPGDRAHRGATPYASRAPHAPGSI